jgi:hypothetical protein
MAELDAKLARLRSIESGQQLYDGGSGREHALRYYLAEMLDEVVRRAAARSQIRAEPTPLPLLISLVGFSPVTSILCFELLRPERLLLVFSQDAKESVEVIARHVVDGGRLPHAEFNHRRCIPTDPSGVYRVVKEELDGMRAGGPGQAVIDITGGRKVMSAAAALAAWQLDLRLCYIETDWDPASRQAVPGTDRLLLLDNPTSIFGEQGMEEALQLFAGGAFEAARSRYKSLCESLADARRARFMRDLSGFYRAWCDLDLTSIPDCARVVEDSLRQAGTGITPETAHRVRSQLGFVGALGDNGERDSFLVCYYVLGEHYRELARHDFASLLYYRTIEGCLTRRLERRATGFSCERPDYGLLSGDVGALREAYAKLVAQAGWKDPDPALPRSVGFMDAAYLLNVLGDDLAGQIEGTKGLKHLNQLASTRNRSVLAHGEQAVTLADCKRLGYRAREVLRAYWSYRAEGPPIDDLIDELRFIRTDR